jgi:hypothetical protein
MNKFSLFLFVFISQMTVLSAQDSHYWGNQYGSRSALMGGAVVGGVRDTSAGFYNPGALGFVDNHSLSVSGNAYSYYNINIPNGAGTGDSLQSERIEAVPTLLSGILKFESAPDHTLGYSVLTRQNFNSKFNGTIDNFQNVITGTDESGNPFSSGNEDFVGQFNSEGRMNEIWLGGSYAYKINQHISLGATLFGAIRTQDANQSYLARAIQTDTGEVSSVTSLSTFDYYNFRTLAKIGAAFDYSPLRFGVTLTTPSVNIAGKGESARDLTVSNLHSEGDFYDFVANDRQDSLSTRYRTPLSIAVGAEYEIESSGTTLAFTAEYFRNQDLFFVMNPEDRPFLRPANMNFNIGSAEFLQVYSAATEVINYAFAVEQRITDGWKAYLGFRVDSSFDRDFEDDLDGLPLSFTSYDIYHATLGAAYRTERSETAFGLQYSYGRDRNYSQAVDFASASEDNFFEGDPSRATLNFRAVTVLLGYTYFF